MTANAPTTRRSTARNVARYAAALACVALVTLYVTSQRWNFFFQTRPVSVEVMGGVIDIHRGGVPSWSITEHNFPWRHRYAFSTAGPYWQVMVPLYVPLIPVVVLTAALWARPPTPAGSSSARRQRPNSPAGGRALF